MRDKAKKNNTEKKESESKQQVNIGKNMHDVTALIEKNEKKRETKRMKNKNGIERNIHFLAI